MKIPGKTRRKMRARSLAEEDQWKKIVVMILSEDEECLIIRVVLMVKMIELIEYY